MNTEEEMEQVRTSVLLARTPDELEGALARGRALLALRGEEKEAGQQDSPDDLNGAPGQYL